MLKDPWSSCGLLDLLFHCLWCDPEHVYPQPKPQTCSIITLEELPQLFCTLENSKPLLLPGESCKHRLAHLFRTFTALRGKLFATWRHNYWHITAGIRQTKRTRLKTKCLPFSSRASIWLFRGLIRLECESIWAAKGGGSFKIVIQCSITSLTFLFWLLKLNMPYTVAWNLAEHKKKQTSSSHSSLWMALSLLSWSSLVHRSIPVCSADHVAEWKWVAAGDNFLLPCTSSKS